jgi:hypothetical protein
MRIGKSRLHSLGDDGTGSGVRGVAACEIAVPPGPHINSAIDELATAGVDENLMAMSSNAGASNSTLVPKDIQLADGSSD